MENLAWQPVAEGAERAVLYGDPTHAGGFVLRFRTVREMSVPLHWHRHDEHITVLAGPFSLSVNGARAELEQGSYVVIPAGAHHRTWYGAGTLIQVNGTGPFESIYVDERQ
jgi:mannose-6-phosphate isomerase-like protein (cupin superfamily)